MYKRQVYYLQYAHARIHSVLRQADAREMPMDTQAGLAALDRLSETHEKQLLVLNQRFPEIIQQAAAQMAPHVLAYYLRELADCFHSYYNAHAFLVEDDAALRNARLSLVQATGITMANGLRLLGVSAPDSM